MRLVVAILGSLFLLAVTGFCVFGFMATFEPTERTAEFLAFRIGYAVVGIDCLIGIAVLVARFRELSLRCVSRIRSGSEDHND